jgi:glycosyltransferase involved in cell wall biosynthesis
VKILLLTPGPVELHRGPNATVQRYREGLQRRGHLCELFGDRDDGDLKQSLEGTLARFRPDLVHAHDAWRTGLQLLGLQIPWVVSVRGDDIFTDIKDPVHGPHVCEVLRQAHRVLVPSAPIARLVEELVPDTVGQIDIVPRASLPLPTGGTDLRRSLGIPRNRLLLLLPGGLRPIKGQARALPVVDILRRHGVDAELVLVGPEQDPEYAAELRAMAADEPRIRILPSLSRERMGATYMNADVVLNTSEEEAMSLSILEAGLLGRPVVASSAAGNRELVTHRETGLIFEDGEGLARCVLALCKNRSAAGALGVRMREDFKRRFDPDREIDRLLSSYAAA